MKNKQNLLLITAFALPVLFIVVMALVVYAPFSSVSTQYDFVYATCGTPDNFYRDDCTSYLNQRFDVVEGRLVVREVPEPEPEDTMRRPAPNENYDGRLFLHDTEANESREISSDDARSLTLSGLITSPDGVTVEGEYNGSPGVFPFFGGSSRYDYYLTKGDKRDVLELVHDNDRYYSRHNFKFIGWVLKDSQ